MTEMAMALGNPYEPVEGRRPGYVGQPFPSVQARIVGEDGAVAGNNKSGELQIKGPNVFKEYWNRPGLAEEEFDGDWFRTGDVALLDDGAPASSSQPHTHSSHQPIR